MIDPASAPNPNKEHIVRRLWFPFHNQRAITLGPFGIWYAEGAYTARTRRHEAVHWEQQRRWLYLPWYLAYVVLLMTVIGRPINKGNYPLSTSIAVYDNIGLADGWLVSKEVLMLRHKGILEFLVPIVIEPDDPGFHGYCPVLKGLHVAGMTEGETLQNAKDAACAYLNSLIKHGEPIPIGVIVREEAAEEVAPNSLRHIGRHTEALRVSCPI